MHGFGEVVERLRRSTVQVHLEDGRGGSGVVWNSSGLILTNAHVARRPEARIQLWDGRIFPARVSARDRRRDLALLRVSGPPCSKQSGQDLSQDLSQDVVAGLLHLSPLEAVSLADPAALRPGALAIAVGSPFGFAGALSTGAIHSVGPVDGLGTQPWVRASVRLAPGNSGGPPQRAWPLPPQTHRGRRPIRLFRPLSSWRKRGRSGRRTPYSWFWVTA